MDAFRDCPDDASASLVGRLDALERVSIKPLHGAAYKRD
jgi:hypothetical protein